MVEGIPDYDELKIRVEPGQAEATYNVLAFGPEVRSRREPLLRHSRRLS